MFLYYNFLDTKNTWVDIKSLGRNLEIDKKYILFNYLKNVHYLVFVFQPFSIFVSESKKIYNTKVSPIWLQITLASV